ncbi:hypothetical protein [Haliangium sp. UPWRP_2]|uniref:hypothetical protein n=1 Tax=Haliangium sp. UPWRP_2 TaxID=1931276 RepID=UPI0011B2627F|nr:hypothetical protein [Haliangium sp. UPWRP_2]
MIDNLPKERAALDALNKLLDDAEVCKRLWEEAGMPLPRPLTALFVSKAAHDDSEAPALPLPLMEIPRPKRPRPLPRGVTHEWIYVPINEAHEASLVRAMLSSTVAHSIAELIMAVSDYGRADVNKGSIANIGSRLNREGVITYTETGWKLREGQNTLEISGDHLWGPLKAFHAQEVAAYRRMSIMHILRSFSGGLQIAQISEALHSYCSWFNTSIPHGQFLIKTDMKTLADKKLVRKIGGSHKWGLVL